MNWREKIKKGMRLISDGCYQAGGFSNCKMNHCPFSDYCWIILKGQDEERGANISAPWYWNEVE
jgi:hypothetical protein